ncbi:MAG: photosynthetic complex putative assembly protein PuhB [Pseudomonadota bacterium]
MPLLHDEEDGPTEPVPGLPAQLPDGETVVWRGQPDALGLAVHAFHIRFVALYFVTAAAVKGSMAGSVSEALTAATPMLLAGAAVTAILLVIAWAMARAAIFTITNKRIIFRSGVAIPKYVNLPFTDIESADLRKRQQTGDIAIRTTAERRAPFLHLWPFVRPLQLRRTTPLMRALPDADSAAKALGNAIKAAAPDKVMLASDQKTTRHPNSTTPPRTKAKTSTQPSAPLSAAAQT